MRIVNNDARELNLKIAYYGPGLSGKTSNLQCIHNHVDPSRRGKMVNVATDTERTLTFDLLAPGLAPVHGYAIRLHLVTVPGPVFYDSSRQQVLKGASGVVFVADSQRERLEANIESLENLYSNLELHGLRPESIPIIFQYNKRDLPNATPVDELDRVLKPSGPRIVATAPKGLGVRETLDACARAVHAAEAERWLEQKGKL